MTEVGVTTDLATCLGLRQVVFTLEQGVDPDLEVDGLDDRAIHLLARVAGAPVGTARILRLGDTGKVGRVCVLAQARGKGIGAALIRAAVAECRGLSGLRRVKLGAQIHALGFYEALGFAAFGPEYLDAGIPHRDMMLVL